MIEFDRARCVGCGACARDCFPEAITMQNGAPTFSAPGACIRCGHCVAVCPMDCVTMPDAQMDEVRPGKPNVSADELLHLMQFRRSTRQYTAEPVTEAESEKLLTAARWCPTAKNAQNTTYIVVREQKTALLGAALEALASLGASMLRNPDLPPDEVRRAEKFVRWLDEFHADPTFDPLFFHAPMLLLFVSKSDPRDAAAAAAYVGLQAAAMGLGCLFSGYFTAVAGQSEAIRTMLGLAPDEQVARCLVLGHPAVQFRRTVPRDAANVRFC
jgi:nitroreductase/NAD-dependent dihydropyrimidine dehydrogenase PreA subunit